MVGFSASMRHSVHLGWMFHLRSSPREEPIKVQEAVSRCLFDSPPVYAGVKKKATRCMCGKGTEAAGTSLNGSKIVRNLCRVACCHLVLLLHAFHIPCSWDYFFYTIPPDQRGPGGGGGISPIIHNQKLFFLRISLQIRCVQNCFKQR